MSIIREPYVAGAFYPDKKEQLLNLLQSFEKSVKLDKKLSKRPKILVVPHAGYIYSGLTAMYAYLTLKNFETPNTILIIGTKHTPYGLDYSLANYEAWKTPLGIVRENLGLVELLHKEGLPIDNLAHELEHSIEVQLPFLQYIYSEVPPIVPMVVANYNLEDNIKVAEKILYVISNIDALIIISTDFSHYEPYEIAKKKDKIAIEDILELNIEKLYNDIARYNITICGIGPLLIAVKIAKDLNLKPELLHYSTSAEASGDYSAVVGYAAIAFY